MPTLDGVRAISILLVITAHPAYRPVWSAFHGAAGVSIFFVLSGYLITTLLLREEMHWGRINFLGFYIRRAFRIYPLYLLVLLAYCSLIYGLGMQPDRRDAFTGNLPYYLFFLPEHAIFFSHGQLPPFDGAWSLGIEEKFYFVWPVLGFTLLRAALGRRLIALAAIAATCTFAPYIVPWASALEPYAQIAIGCSVALALMDVRCYQVLVRLANPIVSAALCVAWLVAQFASSSIGLGRGLYVPYGLLVGLLMIPIATRARGTNWLAWRPLTFVGQISYALYLIHNFGLNLAEGVVPQAYGFASSLLSTTLGIGGATVACWLLSKYFERPLITLGYKLSRQRATHPQGRSGGIGDRDSHRPVRAGCPARQLN
jgi:peptidoglycan/LPS O-acetylase OafA/YrhL